METKILYKEECYKIIGLCMKIHSTLGKGFKEVVYKDALQVELTKEEIPFEREKEFHVQYDEFLLKSKFQADFFIFDSIIIEVKASSQFHADSLRQTLNYLKTSKVNLGIVINFGADKFQFKRVICTY